MSTDLHEMTNTPIEIQIGNVTYRAKRLSIEQLFGYFEARVVSQKIASAKQMAAILDGSDKVEFLRRMHSDLPSGQLLQEMVSDEMGTIPGVRAIIYMAIKEQHPGISEHDIQLLPPGLTPDEMGSYLTTLSATISKVCGFSVGLKVPGTDEEGSGTAGAEKKAPEAESQQ